jgi:hypothetical protein
MDEHKCPKCEKYSAIEEDARSKSFHCLYRNTCDFGSLKFDDYNKIAASLLGRPFNPVDDRDKKPSDNYPLPGVVADKVLELAVYVRDYKNEQLDSLEKKDISKIELFQMRKSGELELIMD